ncbi:MAG: hypothetical protein WBP81_37550 [Solirubrobacteraceae bacterium]
MVVVLLLAMGRWRLAHPPAPRVQRDPPLLFTLGGSDIGGRGASLALLVPDQCSRASPRLADARARAKADLASRVATDLLIASCESRRIVGSAVVETVGPGVARCD